MFKKEKQNFICVIKTGKTTLIIVDKSVFKEDNASSEQIDRPKPNKNESIGFAKKKANSLEILNLFLTSLTQMRN